MNKLLTFVLLLAVATTQACDRCKWNACSTTQYGFLNCSECESGALAYFEAITPGSDETGYTEIVGICEPCPAGCTSCSYQMLSPAMSIPFFAINCTNCLTGYGYNYSSGGCAACSSNCVSCECMGDTCWGTYCLACALGYTLNSSHMYPNCYLSSNTTSLQTDTTSNDHQGAIIGLSIWGALMTIAAVVLVVLYVRQRGAKEMTLLGSETQTRQVTF